MVSDVRQLCCIQKQSVLVMKPRASRQFTSQLPFCCFWSELKVNGQVVRHRETVVCWGVVPRPRVRVSSRDCYRAVPSRCVEVCFHYKVCFVSVFP